jgi:flagellar protein FlbD
MIQLTRLNRAVLVVNSDLIEHIEITPDTVISMTTGQKFMVLETAAEVMDKVVEFRRAICQAAAYCPVAPAHRVTEASLGPPEREQEAADPRRI